MNIIEGIINRIYYEKILCNQKSFIKHIKINCIWKTYHSYAYINGYFIQIKL